MNSFLGADAWVCLRVQQLAWRLLPILKRDCFWISEAVIWAGLIVIFLERSLYRSDGDIVFALFLYVPPYLLMQEIQRQGMKVRKYNRKLVWGAAFTIGRLAGVVMCCSGILYDAVRVFWDGPFIAVDATLRSFAVGFVGLGMYFGSCRPRPEA